MAIFCKDLTATYSTFWHSTPDKVSMLSKFLHWVQGLATCTHLENVDGICYEEQLGAARLK